MSWRRWMSQQWDESVEMKYEIQSIWMRPSGISIQDGSQRGSEASPSLWRSTRPWASHLNQSLGLDVLIFPALFQDPMHGTQEKRKPRSLRSSADHCQLSTKVCRVRCPGPARCLPCTHMLRQPYYMNGGTRGTNMYPALWTLGDGLGNEAYIDKKRGGILSK